MVFKCYATDGETVVKMGKSYVATKKWEDAQHANTQEVVDKNPATYPEADEEFAKATRKKPAGHEGYVRTSPKGKIEQIQEKPYAKKPKGAKEPKAEAPVSEAPATGPAPEPKVVQAFTLGIKQGKPGHLAYIAEARPELKEVLGQFQTALDIDSKLAKLNMEVDKLKAEKRDIGDKLTPLFQKLDTYKLGIHTQEAIMFFKRIVSEKMQYKDLYINAFSKLTDEAKMEMRKLEETMKTISVRYQTELKSYDYEDKQADIDGLVDDAMEHLENLISNREALIALFNGQLPENMDEE